MKLEKAVVQKHYDIGAGYRRLAIEADSIASVVQPGQFIHLKVPGLEESALRRPFSVYQASNGLLSVLYKQVGRGTEVLADLEEGEAVDVIGPLGNGFPIPEPEQGTPVFVAGGYGVAPLYFLARRCGQEGVLFAGGRTREDILCIDEFEALGWEIRLTTEDGSTGTRGLVTLALDDWLDGERDDEPAVMYACGPDGLLRAVDERAQRHGIKAWLSLDKHMGCGVGACLACVQRVRDSSGHEHWLRVCREGPVFESGTLVWGAEA